MKTLSVAIIAKNEEALIRRCLESVRGADQIVVVDTGSTDRTMQIARECGAEVHEFPWIDDFAAARNEALKHCTSDYVLSIDCDEVLDPRGIARVRQSIETGLRGYAITMKAEGFPQYHYPVRLFKRDPDIYWVGRGHEAVNVGAEEQTSILITYGYSPAHDKDPDRMLRIMQKAHGDERSGRNCYYLAREFYYRKRYDDAIVQFEECLRVSTWMAEKADAQLYIARCYWYTGRGDQARAAAFEAVRLNPMFKEALLFLSETHYSPHKEAWAILAGAADNTGVLFVRT